MGRTPLHIAASKGDEEMVKFLHTAKANPNILDNVRCDYLYIYAFVAVKRGRIYRPGSILESTLFVSLLVFYSAQFSEVFPQVLWFFPNI